MSNQTSAQAKKPNLHIDADEDLDELDDVLSEFASPTAKPATSAGPPPISPLVSPPPPPPTATTTTSFNRPRTNTRVDSAPISLPGRGRPSSTIKEGQEDDADLEASLSDEFTKELVKNMQDLMKELTASGTAGAEDVTEHESDQDGLGESDKAKEAERLMKAAWEAMLIEGMDGMTEPDSTSEKEKGADFQSKIKQTMEKLKESEINLQQNSSSSSSAGPDGLHSILNSLKDLEGEGNEEDEAELAGFLENMMGQLMGKEVLYEPLKELSEKFPAYLANPPSDLSSSDKTRYEKQYEYVEKIIAIFDDPGYKESDQATGERVAELMGEMQNYGAPPESIMGPMPPELGPEGNCVIS